VRVSGGGQPALDNRIGGPILAERNFITGYGTWNSDGYPGGTTVELFDTTGTLIENNWIGTTPDDPLDADSGGNGLQNFPVLQSATLQGAAQRVVGALHSSLLSQLTPMLHWIFPKPRGVSRQARDARLFRRVAGGHLW
jgi:hypothetical protein